MVNRRATPADKSGQKALKRRRLAVTVALLAVSIAWAAVQWALLPYAVVVQPGADGTAANLIPKLFAVAIPFVISTLFALLYQFRDGQKKHLLWSLLGLLLPVVNLALNL